MESGDGISAFLDLLVGRASVVAGPSGVGKSSLLQPLFPDREIRVGAVSEANEKGRHTTTAATWYPLPGGGAVVDTPGFRDYALWDLSPAGLAALMPDLLPHLGSCRFRNCLHRTEPECGVREAAAAGTITAHRYRSYLGILDNLREQEGRH